MKFLFLVVLCGIVAGANANADCEVRAEAWVAAAKLATEDSDVFNLATLEPIVVRKCCQDPPKLKQNVSVPVIEYQLRFQPLLIPIQHARGVTPCDIQIEVSIRTLDHTQSVYAFGVLLGHRGSVCVGNTTTETSIGPVLPRIFAPSQTTFDPVPASQAMASISQGSIKVPASAFESFKDMYGSYPTVYVGIVASTQGDPATVIPLEVSVISHNCNCRTKPKRKRSSRKRGNGNRRGGW